MASAWRDYTADGILRDGASVHIRAIRPDDRTELARGFAELSPEAVYFRFFRVKHRLTDAELTQFTELDFGRRAALVATRRVGDEERIIAIARYAVTDDAPGPPHRAEVAFTVGDAFQGRGLGTLLLEHLAVLARANGITEFEADVLGENNRMLSVFAKSGFRVRRSLADGVFHVSFPTEETAEHTAVTDRRTQTAAARSLRPILAPRAVAVVGASREPGSIGAALVENLRAAGFTGAIHPVNPHAESVGGLRCHPTVQAIGQRVDLAVIAVPAVAVLDVVQDCARAGVHGVVVVSAGFAEVSDAGREAQRMLVELVRSSGMRLVGPNCMGVLNTDPAVSLNATFAPTWPAPGGVGMLSQGGALGLAILDHLRGLNLGVSTFVSVGNRADVSSNDLLSYWAEDVRTRVVLLYLETFGNPRTFARLAPAVARVKPIVAVKSGRSGGGRAARRHPASPARTDAAVDALFAHAGVIRTPTLEAMFDVAALLSTQPPPPGPRVGVVTNAAAPGVLFADACEARDLVLPPLAPATLESLRAVLPADAALANPIDLRATGTAEHYERALAQVGADPGVDAVVVLYVPPVVTRPDDVAAAIARGAGRVPAEKPVLAVFLSARGAPALLGTGPRGAIPSYSFPENAAEALAAAVGWNRWRARPVGSAFALGPFAREAVRAVVDRVLAGADEGGWLEPEDLATILRAAGVGFAEIVRATPEGAVGTAPRLGYPLVAKAVSPGLLPGSDLRGVERGLDGPDGLAAAVERLGARLAEHGRRLDGVLLQREVQGGIDALVGVTTDPTFGPLVTCGLGGSWIGLLDDVSYGVPPVTDVDAEEMLSRLGAARLLAGYRGAPPGDRAALVSTIQRISALADIVPELLDLELSPVKVLAPGRGAIVVDGRMRIGRPSGPLGPPSERTIPPQVD